MAKGLIRCLGKAAGMVGAEEKHSQASLLHPQPLQEPLASFLPTSQFCQSLSQELFPSFTLCLLFRKTQGGRGEIDLLIFPTKVPQKMKIIYLQTAHAPHLGDGNSRSLLEHHPQGQSWRKCILTEHLSRWQPPALGRCKFPQLL